MTACQAELADKMAEGVTSRLGHDRWRGWNPGEYDQMAAKVRDDLAHYGGGSRQEAAAGVCLAARYLISLRADGGIPLAHAMMLVSLLDILLETP